MMKRHDYHNEFRQEKLLLSLGFVAICLIVGGLYAAQHAHELLFIAAQAADHPKEIWASVIRGIAY